MKYLKKTAIFGEPAAISGKYSDYSVATTRQVAKDTAFEKNDRMVSKIDPRTYGWSGTGPSPKSTPTRPDTATLLARDASRHIAVPIKMKAIPTKKLPQAPSTTVSKTEHSTYMPKEASPKFFVAARRGYNIQRKAPNIAKLIKEKEDRIAKFKNLHKAKDPLLKHAAAVQTTFEVKGKKVYQVLESNTEFANSTQPNQQYKYFKRKDEVKDFATKTLVRRSESPLLKKYTKIG